MSVFLCYHCPCLDGAYSSLVSFLFFREMSKEGTSAKDFIRYIADIEDFENIKQNVIEYKHSKDTSNKESEESKLSKANKSKSSKNEYSPLIKDVVYLPAETNSNSIFSFPYSKYREDLLKESVLIFMDYSGGTVNNLVELSKKFLKVILIDHHLSLEYMLNDLKEVEESPTNILHLYRTEKCGSTLTLEFFEKVKGGQLLANKERYEKLTEILKYVEDNDIKAGKIENSNEFVSGILKKRIRLDLYSNTNMFKDLFDIKVSSIIEAGIKEQLYRKNRVEELAKEKRVILLGGRISGGKGKYGTCFGLTLTETELRSEIGNYLAKESFEAGYENMGFIMIKSNSQYRISLRSLKGLPGGDCEIIAREFGGGGHFNAAGFFLSKKELKKWFDK